jgi:hypothetical protein
MRGKAIHPVFQEQACFPFATVEAQLFKLMDSGKMVFEKEMRIIM